MRERSTFLRGDVPGAVLPGRRRHPGHFDQALLPDLDTVIATAQPLGLGPVVRVATDRSVDVGSLVAKIRSAVRA